MLDFSSIQGLIALVVSVAAFLAKVAALADCIGRRPSDFVVADTLSKRAWLIILGFAVAAHLLWWNPLGLLNLVGTIAALVYLAQLRSSTP